MSKLAHSFTLTRNDTTNKADKYDHGIRLVDRTRPKEEEAQPSEQVTTEIETDNEDRLSAPLRTHSLTHALSKTSIANELKRRKYAKWAESRYPDAVTPSDPPVPGLDQDPASDVDHGETSVPQKSGSKLPSRRDTVRKHRHKVQNVMKDAVFGSRQRNQHSDATSQFDVLYENQRGFYFCGIPRYSSNTLLNFDPPPWQTGNLQPSIVNITDAQVPDPSWRWADEWHSWYVDMSGDVDDEGWKYSFTFAQRFKFLASHWHGTHPFGSSFVRRRRWVRLRVKRTSRTIRGDEARTTHGAHLLDADYFTIHKSGGQFTPDGTSVNTDSRRQSVGTSKRWSELPEDEDEDAEVSDIASLLNRLREASIDRQRLGLINNFLAHGGEEIFYLTQNMSSIVGLFIFQTSRRQLLDLLCGKLEEAAEQDKKDSRRKQKDEGGHEAKAKSRTDALETALHAAQEECRRLGMASGRDFGNLKKELEDAWADGADDTSDIERAADGSMSLVGQTTTFAKDSGSSEEREVCEEDHNELHESGAESAEPKRSDSENHAGEPPERDMVPPVEHKQDSSTEPRHREGEPEVSDTHGKPTSLEAWGREW